MPTITPAIFSLDAVPTTDAGVILRTGKLFATGDYPDKNFSLTDEEMSAAVAAFMPVRNNLEHKPTILDGQLGELRSVECRGSELFGTVAVPAWLNTLLGSDPLKASLEWTRDTKQIVGNALVLNPRVADAHLVAAFTAAQNPPEKEHPMGLLDKLKALFSGDKAPTEDEVKAVFTAEVSLPKVEEKPTPTPPATFTADPAQAAAIVGLQKRLLTSEAEAWFNAALADQRCFPSQKADLIAAFCQAAQGDNAGTVCFSEEGVLREGHGLAALKKAVSLYPQHGLTTERIEAAVASGKLVTMSMGGDKPFVPTPEKPFASDADKAALIGKGTIKPKG